MKRRTETAHRHRARALTLRIPDDRATELGDLPEVLPRVQTAFCRAKGLVPEAVGLEVLVHLPLYRQHQRLATTGERSSVSC